MDHKSADPSVGCDAGPIIPTDEEAVAFVRSRYAAAQEFADRHNLGELSVYASMVAADKVTIAWRPFAGHVEWQLWFLPDPEGGAVTVVSATSV